MGKIKSAILLTLITLIVAVLCVVCFVPFPVGGDGIHYFNPIINWADKSADLGGYQYGEEAAYLGGSYSVVFYPEGVISAKQYSDNADSDETEYIAYNGGSVYLDKEKVCGGGTEPTEEFKAAFDVQLRCLKERFGRLHSEGTVLEVRDGFTVQATLPASLDASVAAFLYYSYMGDVTVLYGTSSDAASATQIIPETGSKPKAASEYVKGASMRSNMGTAFVEVDFTDAGLEILSDATSGAAESAGYLFVQVGGETVINLSVSEQIDDNLYVSGSYTNEAATIVANTIDTALDCGDLELGMEMGELHRSEAGFAPLTFGSVSLSALDLVYIACGVAILAMAVFFLIRYGLLGFANILTYLFFLELMVLIYWAVPIAIGAGTLAAFAISSVLLCASNALSYEAARKEYAVGKTMASSVKTGYKKCFWHIFDLHIALVAIALLVYLIALTELSVFGLALTFGVALAGICSLLVNRFLWYLTMGLSKNPGKFCHFKREEVEDDD